jgi:SsrA-binding protein
MTVFADNRKAFFDYFIEERVEAGLVLEGWEVKSIREKRVQLKEAYVIIKDGEMFVLNSHISPMSTASKHVNPLNTRTRKLLLNAKEIARLKGKVEQKGYTLIPLNFHEKNGYIKCEVALAKGKKNYDKRDSEKNRDWQVEKARIMKNNKV